MSIYLTKILVWLIKYTMVVYHLPRIFYTNVIYDLVNRDKNGLGMINEIADNRLVIREPERTMLISPSGDVKFVIDINGVSRLEMLKDGTWQQPTFEPTQHKASTTLGISAKGHFIK